MLLLPGHKGQANYDCVRLVPRCQLLPVNLARLQTFENSVLGWLRAKGTPSLPGVRLLRPLCVGLCCVSAQATVTDTQPLDQQTHFWEYFLLIYLHCDSQHC